jgi:hypothetical protein
MVGAGVTPPGLGLLVLSLLVVATPARALVVDPAQALALAHKRNPTLRIFAADVDAARGRHRQAGVVPTNPVLWLESASHTVGRAAFFDRGISPPSSTTCMSTSAESEAE